MKTVAYLRVSKDTQDVNNQRLAVLQFAQRERIQVDQFMEVTVSSRKSAKDRRIDMLLEQLCEGDTLIVSELSRMGRSVGEIITIVDTLVKKRICFMAVKQGIRLNGFRSCEDIQTKVMISPTDLPMRLSSLTMRVSPSRSCSRSMSISLSLADFREETVTSMN